MSKRDGRIAPFLSPGSFFYDTQINQLQPVINDDNHKMKPVRSLSTSKYDDMRNQQFIYDTQNGIFIMSLFFCVNA